MSKRIAFSDFAFFFSETASCPANVSTLQVYDRPDIADNSYLTRLVDELERSPAGFPFDRNLNRSPFLLPQWVVNEDLDLSRHVNPFGLCTCESEDVPSLAAYVHARQLPLKRPLWECHFIDISNSSRFALVTKMHHSIIDGVGGVSATEHCLNDNPGGIARPPWQSLPERPENANNLGRNRLWNGIRGAWDLTRLISIQLFKLLGIVRNEAPGLFTAPKTILNVPVSNERKFVPQTYSLNELKCIAKRNNATVNDVVLAICGGALRKYLLDHSSLPRRSLVTMTPVSIRKSGMVGNEIALMCATLATDVEDPIERLNKIKGSTQKGKSDVGSYSLGALKLFMTFSQAAVGALNFLKVSDKIRPAANLIISNVPGPRKQLYLGDSRLVANYPMGMLMYGQALNITIFSYGDSLDFGILACGDAFPDLDKLAVYMRDSFNQLKSSSQNTH